MLVSNFTAHWYRAIAEKRENASRHGCSILLDFLEKYQDKQEVIDELFEILEPEKLDKLNLLCLLATTIDNRAKANLNRKKLIYTLSAMLSDRDDREQILCGL